MAQCKQFTCSVTLHPKGNSPSAYRHFLPVVNFLCLTTVPAWLTRILIRHLFHKLTDCPGYACKDAQCSSTLYNKRLMEYIFFVIQLRKAPSRTHYRCSAINDQSKAKAKRSSSLSLPFQDVLHPFKCLTIFLMSKYLFVKEQSFN